VGGGAISSSVFVSESEISQPHYGRFRDFVGHESEQDISLITSAHRPTAYISLELSGEQQVERQ
jgi:hypothetical protein